MPPRLKACDSHQRTERDHVEFSRRLLELLPAATKLKRRLIAKSPKLDTDLIHDAVLDAQMKAAESYNPQASALMTLKSFFHRIAMQQLATAIERSNALKRGGEDVVLNQERLSAGRIEGSERSWEELLPGRRDDISVFRRSILLLALERLGMREKLLLDLYYWRDMPVKEIVTLTAMTEYAIRKSLDKAHIVLRNSLEEWSARLRSLSVH